MAEFTSDSNVEFTITVKLSEAEARALHAITTYGSAAFMQSFFETLGHSYLKPHSKGVESLFSTVSKEIPKHLKQVDAARAAFKGL